MRGFGHQSQKEHHRLRPSKTEEASAKPEASAIRGIGHQNQKEHHRLRLSETEEASAKPQASAKLEASAKPEASAKQSFRHQRLRPQEHNMHARPPQQQGHPPFARLGPAPLHKRHGAQNRSAQPCHSAAPPPDGQPAHGSHAA